MKHRMLVAILGIVLGATAFAAGPDPQLMAPIHKFMDDFNKGDAAGAATTHSPTEDLTIIDEVPPYLWKGPRAFQTWVADLTADESARGISDQAVSIGEPTRVETKGEWAYVIVPSAYRFKEHGKPMHATAQMTFVLKKEASGWLIHGWTWTGPKAKPAAPAKK